MELKKIVLTDMEIILWVFQKIQYFRKLIQVKLIEFRVWKFQLLQQQKIIKKALRF